MAGINSSRNSTNALAHINMPLSLSVCIITCLHFWQIITQQSAIFMHMHMDKYYMIIALHTCSIVPTKLMEHKNIIKTCFTAKAVTTLVGSIKTTQGTNNLSYEPSAIAQQTKQLSLKVQLSGEHWHSYVPAISPHWQASAPNI